MKLRLSVVFAFFFLGACTLDIGNGSQLAGQRCFQESDCTDGLTCHERVCVPMLGSGSGGERDMGTEDMSTDDSGTRPDGGGTPDGGQLCTIGERRCASATDVEVCVDNGGQAGIRVTPCADNEVCDGGRCVEVGPGCRDNDGDGYGAGCPLGFDCDDTNPRVNPGAREDCSTRGDDNCDGRRNENCNPDDCCGGGCGGDEFCSTQCVCQPYDPFFCESQNQPCVQEGDFENGFYCIAFGASNEPRCWGICDVNAANPDATCPDPNTVCAFDAGDGQAGICMSTCGTDAAGMVGSCGEPDLGCLNIDLPGADGICAPINPDNQQGDQCETDYFFDCDAGLVCVPGNQGNRGRCREACRPFFWGPSSTQTDCDQGHCLPFSADFGICFNDNNSMEGASCGPPQSACNDDAVGCYDGGQNDRSCLRLCRLDAGSSDCLDPNQNCSQFDMQQTELGICF